MWDKDPAIHLQDYIRDFFIQLIMVITVIPGRYSVDDRKNNCFYPDKNSFTKKILLLHFLPDTRYSDSRRH